MDKYNIKNCKNLLFVVIFFLILFCKFNKYINKIVSTMLDLIKFEVKKKILLLLYINIYVLIRILKIKLIIFIILLKWIRKL